MAREKWRPSELRKWGPVRGIEELDRFIEENLPGWPVRVSWRRSPAEDIPWAPATEVYETDEEFIVRAELPGVEKDDISISVTGDTLTIKGHRKATEGISDEQYRRCEFAYGDFSRSIGLQVEVDAEKTEATHDNGVLEIRLPKSKAAVAKRIEIKAQ